jgi:hypothetical protein
MCPSKIWQKSMGEQVIGAMKAGIQFRLQSSMHSNSHLIKYCGDELVMGKLIHAFKERPAHIDRFPERNRLATLFLKTWETS